MCTHVRPCVRLVTPLRLRYCPAGHRPALLLANALASTSSCRLPRLGHCSDESTAPGDAVTTIDRCCPDDTAREFAFYKHSVVWWPGG